MAHRLGCRAGSVCWTVLVTAVLVGAPLVVSGRLPDPMATHWDFAGVPDSATSETGFVLLTLPIWLGITALAVITDRAATRRAGRGFAAAVHGAGGVFCVGLTLSTVLANVDSGDWRQVMLPLWQLPVALVATVLAGAVAYRLGRRGPEDPHDEVEMPAELLPTSATPRVWNSSVVSRSMSTLAGVLALACAVLAVASAWWPETIPLGVMLAPLIASLAVLEFSVARVQVDERGICTKLGPLRWPVRRIRLDRVRFARSGTYRAIEVGGWGYRLTPNATAIMLRGGDCLVVRLTTGRDFVISVDAPEQGAQVINALVAGRG